MWDSEDKRHKANKAKKVQLRIMDRIQKIELGTYRFSQWANILVLIII